MARETLYELTSQLEMLMALSNDPDVDPQTLLDTMESVEGDYDAKMEGYAKVITSIEAQTKAIREEEKRLAERRKTKENNIAKMKKVMFESMKTVEKDVAGGNLFTIRIQKNGGNVPVIVDWLSEDLPDELVKITRTPDLEKIREQLMLGNQTVKKMAHFGERGESLRIV